MVVIDPADGREVLRHRTYRRSPDELQPEILTLCAPPDDMTAAIPFDFLNPDGTVLHRTNIQAVLKRWILGGRPKGSVSRNRQGKVKDRKELYDDFIDSKLSEAAYLKQHPGLTRGQLRYAIDENTAAAGCKKGK